jgi:DNA-binding PadR family transcriptional regulator
MKLITRAEELVLLAIWRLKEKAYCVPILDQVEEVTGKKWTLGSIYITLHRLEKRKLVESALGNPTSERGGKSKRFYSVTPLGVKALQAIRKVERIMWDGISGIVKGKSAR